MLNAALHHAAHLAHAYNKQEFNNKNKM